MAAKRQTSRNHRPTSMARPMGVASSRQRRRIFRTRRRFGWGWIKRLPLPWIGSSLLCVGLLYFITASGTFTVRAISAPNLKSKEMSQIIARCRCLGQNIFTLKTDEIKQRLNGIPALAVNRVYTTLPNGLRIEAVYKQRVAIWRTPEAAYAVADDGQVLQVWRKPFPKHGWKNLPVFDEAYDSSVKKGHRLLVGEHVNAAGLQMALSMNRHMPSTLKPLVKTYLFRPFTGEILIGRADWWALFGLDTSKDLDLRLQSLVTVLDKRPPLLTPGKCVDMRPAGFNHASVIVIHPNHNCG